MMTTPTEAMSVQRLFESLNEPKAKPIVKFCKDYNISRATFYNLDNANKAPKTIMIGGKRYVTAKAEAAWLESLENDAA